MTGGGRSWAGGWGALRQSPLYSAEDGEHCMSMLIAVEKLASASTIWTHNHNNKTTKHCKMDDDGPSLHVEAELGAWCEHQPARPVETKQSFPSLFLSNGLNHNWLQWSRWSDWRQIIPVPKNLLHSTVLKEIKMKPHFIAVVVIWVVSHSFGRRYLLRSKTAQILFSLFTLSSFDPSNSWHA